MLYKVNISAEKSLVHVIPLLPQQPAHSCSAYLSQVRIPGCDNCINMNIQWQQNIQCNHKEC